jgi:hypothetical protein
MALIYRPDHPLANENGLIERALVDPDSAPLGLYVISDTMDPTRHMATGKMHTSKSEFRKDTKAAGCIEYGSDQSLYKPRKRIPLSREKRVDDIRKTIYDLRNGRARS